MQNFYEFIFKNDNFRINLENIDKDMKKNKYIKVIIDFLNSNKKRPISLPNKLVYENN